MESKIDGRDVADSREEDAVGIRVWSCCGGYLCG